MLHEQPQHRLDDAGVNVHLSGCFTADLDNLSLALGIVDLKPQLSFEPPDPEDYRVPLRDQPDKLKG